MTPMARRLSPLQQAGRPRLAARRRQILLRRGIALGVLALVLVLLAVVVIAASSGGSASEHGARVIRYSVTSRYVRATLPQVAVLPPGSNGSGRPLLVFLHGKTSDGQDQSLDSAMFAALAAQGTQAPDVVFPNGGDGSYWHNRANGRWGSYVLHEVIPRALAVTHADPKRIAIGGISMGGFGALDLARLKPGTFCAVGAHSAAIWLRGSDTAAGAFDNAADFARHDLIKVARSHNPYGRTPVWLDVGTADPFATADAALAAELRRHHARLQFSSSPGGHDDAYWQAHWRAYMTFYAKALAACHG